VCTWWKLSTWIHLCHPLSKWRQEDMKMEPYACGPHNHEILQNRRFPSELLAQGCLPSNSCLPHDWSQLLSKDPVTYGLSFKIVLDGFFLRHILLQPWMPLWGDIASIFQNAFYCNS
jgi:hypothetical protein